MSQQYEPQVWQRSSMRSRQHWVDIIGPFGVFAQVSDIYGTDIEKDRVSMICAAPDLYAALEACLPDLQHYASTHGPGPDRRLEAARAAIAKARGEVSA